MTMDLVQKHYTQHRDKSFQAGTILPWTLYGRTLRGSFPATELNGRLEAGFKGPTINECRKFHDLAGACLACRIPRRNGAGLFCSSFLRN